MRILSLLAIFMCFAAQALADGSITGNVVDQTGQPLPFANVIAYRGESLVKGSVTDASGFFELNNLKDGEYSISFQMMGYQTITRSVPISSAKRVVKLGNVTMEIMYI